MRFYWLQCTLKNLLSEVTHCRNRAERKACIRLGRGKASLHWVWPQCFAMHECNKRKNWEASAKLDNLNFLARTDFPFPPLMHLCSLSYRKTLTNVLKMQPPSLINKANRWCWYHIIYNVDSFANCDFSVILNETFPKSFYKWYGICMIWRTKVHVLSFEPSGSFKIGICNSTTSPGFQ